MTSKRSEEFEKFDKAMDKILSVSKEELDRRLKAAKKAKKGKRYPKQEKQRLEFEVPDSTPNRY